MFVSEVPADHVDCSAVRGAAADQSHPVGGVDDRVARPPRPPRPQQAGGPGLVQPQGEREARVTGNTHSPAPLHTPRVTAGLAVQDVSFVT